MTASSPHRPTIPNTEDSFSSSFLKNASVINRTIKERERYHLRMTFFRDATLSSISAVTTAVAFGPIERIITSPSVLRQDGLRVLWRGLDIRMLRAVPQNTIALLAMERQRIRMLADQYYDHTFLVNCYCGAMSGAITQFLLHPFERAHNRVLAGQGVMDETRRYRGVMDSMTQMARQGGIRALYVNFMSALQFSMVFRSLSLGGYETLKQNGYFGSLKSDVSLDERSVSLMKRCAGAFSVTAMSAWIAHPFDVVRGRMMMQEGAIEKLYGSRQHCMRDILAVEGVTAFYRGALNGILRHTGSAAMLVIFDIYKEIYQQY